MTLVRYFIGFALSLMLTLAAYDYVVYRGDNTVMLSVLGILAVAQMVVQLVFFLHLGDEVKPRYKLYSILFMAGILLIVIGGSLWIMVNLNNNMAHMSPTEKTNYMMTQHDKGF